MTRRIALFLLFILVNFNILSCEREKLALPYLGTAKNFISKVKSENIFSEEEQCTLKERVLDCADLYKIGYKENGVYAISPVTRLISIKRLDVYCDMTTGGGGWTVIQRRGDFDRKDDYFDRDWQGYKTGFGSIKKDFWLGNDNIFVLTNQKLYSVRFDLVDKEHNKIYAEYDKFWIDDEFNNYTLHISDYSGKAGNAMEYHDRMKFSTKDRDNDMRSGHCAREYNSGWWFNHCNHGNLNGRYNNQTWGIRWYHEKTKHFSLLRSEIKIRPMLF